MSESDPMLDKFEVAELLGKSHKTIIVDVSRAPHRVPPFVRVGPKTIRWRLSTVLEWLSDLEQQTKDETARLVAAKIRARRTGRRPGRPTKAEQIARRKAEATG